MASDHRYFDGDFDLLPLRAHLDGGPVSTSAGAFELAVSALRGAEDAAPGGTITWEVAAARWRVEAIRERRMHGESASVTSRAVYARTAAALFDWSREAT